ncbi:MAG TPA: MFS transporter [Pirellulaceae bacterium]|nr:MFS transporter [Pirellulaceae bacterium]
MSSPVSTAKPLTFTQWMICTMAAIGFAFDIYELLMLPLIIRPSLLELTGATPGTPTFNYWGGMLFYVPAVAGGIFGLMGGYLTDRLGRRRVLTWSILLFAFSKFFAGFSTSVWVLLILRSTAFVGVCVEFVAAVAWVAELFPDPKQREKALGYTQAFSSLGGLMIAIANGLCIQFANQLPPIFIPEALTGIFGTIEVAHQHEPWRYTLISGLIPAIPLIIIRPFLPESPVWAEKRKAGTLKRPTILALFSPELARTSIVTAIGFACTLGIAFGAIQQMPQIVPGLPEVQAGAKKASDAAVAKAKAKGEANADTLAAVARGVGGAYRQKIASEYTKMQEVGGLIGRFLIALVLAAGVLRWGNALRLFQLPGLILVPLVFWFFLRAPNRTFFEIPLEAVYLGTVPVTTMSVGMFLVGMFVVAQLSFWGNYLPHVYPIHLRGTGESFAANIGGRLIGTFAAMLTWSLSGLLPYKDGPLQFSTAAAIVGTTIAVIGFLASFWLPEPHPKGGDE